MFEDSFSMTKSILSREKNFSLKITISKSHIKVILQKVKIIKVICDKTLF